MGAAVDARRRRPRRLHRPRYRYSHRDSGGHGIRIVLALTAAVTTENFGASGRAGRPALMIVLPISMRLSAAVSGSEALRGSRQPQLIDEAEARS